MKKQAVKTQKKDDKSVEKVKRSASKRTTSKKVEVVAVVEAVPETIEQPAEQPEQQSTDVAVVISPPESAILQDGSEPTEVTAVIESAEVTEQPPEPQTPVNTNTTIPKESKVLRERLGLVGYITETVKLPSNLEILGCKAEGVVFAKQIDGVDRVLLHVSLVDAAGKRSIVSSRKKVPQPEWQAISESLTALSISWRDKELKRAVK